MAGSQEGETESLEENGHPLLNHPLASKLMEAIETWIQDESLGKDEVKPSGEVRSLAKQMMQDDLATRKRAVERP